MASAILITVNSGKCIKHVSTVTPYSLKYRLASAKVQALSLSYTMVMSGLSNVQADNPWYNKACGLSYVQADNPWYNYFIPPKSV